MALEFPELVEMHVLSTGIVALLKSVIGPCHHHRPHPITSDQFFMM